MENLLYNNAFLFVTCLTVNVCASADSNWWVKLTEGWFIIKKKDNVEKWWEENGDKKCKKRSGKAHNEAIKGLEKMFLLRRRPSQVFSFNTVLSDYWVAAGLHLHYKTCFYRLFNYNIDFTKRSMFTSFHVRFLSSLQNTASWLKHVQFRCLIFTWDKRLRWD